MKYTRIPGVLQLGNDTLRKYCYPVLPLTNLLRHEQLQRDTERLHEKLSEFRTVMGYGRGIAAPQIGVLSRIVAFNLSNQYPELSKPEVNFTAPTDGLPFTLYNPTITFHHQEDGHDASSSSTFTMWDDCMSFPHLMVRLQRHTSCDVTFHTIVPLTASRNSSDIINNNGNTAAVADIDVANNEALVEINWKNVPQPVSELIQHEVDHLNGVLAIDRALDEKSVVDRHEFLLNQTMYEERVEYTIVPTVVAQ